MLIDSNGHNSRFDPIQEDANRIESLRDELHTFVTQTQQRLDRLRLSLAEAQPELADGDAAVDADPLARLQALREQIENHLSGDRASVGLAEAAEEHTNPLLTHDHEGQAVGHPDHE